MRGCLGAAPTCMGFFPWEHGKPYAYVSTLFRVPGAPGFNIKVMSSNKMPAFFDIPPPLYV
jgi:hypothetical protein